MPNTKITIPRPMTREKKGNLPRSGVTAVSPALNQREKIPFSPTQLAPPHPPSSPSPASYISVPFFFLKALAIPYFLFEKFPDLPGSSVLEPFEPFEPFQYGRQHVFDPLSPGMPRLIRLFTFDLQLVYYICFPSFIASFTQILLCFCFCFCFCSLC